jgi:hypothetical protein
MSFRNGCLFNRDFVFFALNISDMKNSFFLAAFLFGSISVTTAQTLPDPPEQIWPTKKWNFQSVRLNAYYNIYSPKLVDAAAIKLLAADANTLSIPSDLADFNRREDSQQGSLGNLVVIGSVAFSPKSKNDNTINRRKTVQLGLGYQDLSTFETAYSINEKVTGTDSSISRDYFVSGRQKAMFLQGAHIWNTDPDKAVNIYAGVGLDLGYSLSSVLVENTNKSYIYTSSDSSSNTFLPNEKTLDGVSYFNVALVVPFGFHARIYKNWGTTAEFRYALNSTIASGASSLVRSHFQAGLGVRYTFGKFADRKPEQELDDL